jgi:hypothetical protein
MAITDDNHDSNAIGRDFMRLSHAVNTKGDVPGHLIAILGKCVRHPSSEYAPAAKTNLISFVVQDPDVKDCLETMIKNYSDQLKDIIPLAKDILEIGNKKLAENNKATGLKSKL